MENQSTRSAACVGGSKILVGILSLAVDWSRRGRGQSPQGAVARWKLLIPAGTTVIGALQNSVRPRTSDVGDAVVLKTTEPSQLSSGSLPAGASLTGSHLREGRRPYRGSPGTHAAVYSTRSQRE